MSKAFFRVGCNFFYQRNLLAFLTASVDCIRKPFNVSLVGREVEDGVADCVDKIGTQGAGAWWMRKGKVRRRTARSKRATEYNQPYIVNQSNDGPLLLSSGKSVLSNFGTWMSIISLSDVFGLSGSDMKRTTGLEATGVVLTDEGTDT